MTSTDPRDLLLSLAVDALDDVHTATVDAMLPNGWRVELVDTDLRGLTFTVRTYSPDGMPVVIADAATRSEAVDIINMTRNN